MGALTWLLHPELSAEQTVRPGPMDDLWYKPVGEMSASGVSVSPESAMRQASYYAGASLLAAMIACLPCITYQDLDTKGRRRAKENPIYNLLRWRPNVRQSAINFWSYVIISKINRGNFYGRFVPGPEGPYSQIFPIHPDRVEVELLSSGKKRYKVWNPGGGYVYLLQDEVLHIMSLTSDGIVGTSLISSQRDTIGLAIAEQKYAQRSFANSTRLSGVLTTPQKLGVPERQHITESWNTNFAGSENSGKVALLEADLKFQAIQMTNQDSQLLESMKFSRSQIAGILNVPAHMIGDPERPGYASLESENLRFIMHSLRPHIITIEQDIHNQMLSPLGLDDEYYTEFLVDALLRGDTLTRYQAYASAITQGWQTRNEVRLRENMEPLEGLDEPLEPVNMRNPGGNQQNGVPNQGERGGSPASAGVRDAEVRSNKAAFEMARGLATQSAGEIIRREISALTRIAKKTADNKNDWNREVIAFYHEHAELVATKLRLSALDAVSYCDQQREAVLQNGIKITQTWEETRTPALVELVIGGEK